ncbi:hypothetical protein H5410_002435 [Solanum commersonii]|uniref:Longin domain-containing protein n=1 Tax=Solanum commersonii TaxID=4109 RepID=A0A9J6B1X0_SOLCO|nr:hypothetical protein H5410_002435 [Solanum commersonii]
MPNGSFHGSKSGLLDWPMRYKIAMDAAEGLSYYLHIMTVLHPEMLSQITSCWMGLVVTWLQPFKNEIYLYTTISTRYSTFVKTENSVSHLSYPSLLPLTENAVLGRIPFSYLEDIQMRFMKNYGKVASYAPAYSINDEFSRASISKWSSFQVSNPSADTLNRVRGDVGEASIFSVYLRQSA